MDTKKITLGITAHVDAGKTTLSEAMLYLAGELKQPGRVDHGSAFLDDDPIEKERGITIFSRQAHFTIAGCTGEDGKGEDGKGEGGKENGKSPGSKDGKSPGPNGGKEKGQEPRTEVTLIDTPGHVDFSAEMERSLWVLDHALLVISGSEGVQAHTKTLARMLKERGIPVFVFVNKMDIAIKSKDELTSSIEDELDLPAVDFSGAAQRTEKFIDDVTLRSAQLAEAVLENLPESEADGRSDGSDPGGSKVSDDGQVLSDGQIAAAVASCEIVPVMFGSALKVEGVSELLEVIGRYAKAPSYKKEFGAKVYKTMTDKDGEKLSFIKITGGSLRVKDSVTVNDSVTVSGTQGDQDGSASGRAAGNTNKCMNTKAAASDRNQKNDQKSSREINRKTNQKINQIRLYSGSRFKTTDEAGAGTVCAVTGLGNLLPGTALGEEEAAPACAAEPFMAYTVCVPDGKNPHEVMDDMQTLTAEDPALAASWSRDGSEILIRIMGEVQLEVLRQIIKERFGYEVSFGQGQVLYLETITDTYEGVGHFEPLRHYAEVHLVISPGERGSGIVITSDVPEDELALNWQRLIWTHLEEKKHTGVLTGAPLTDLKISIAAGRAHLKHTMGGDFREATYRAVRNAMMQAKRDGNVLLLEPWCEYEIELPAKDIGRAATDIKQMGGTQESLEQGNGAAAGTVGNGPGAVAGANAGAGTVREMTAVIKGKVPSVKIEPYRQILAGYTSGEGKMILTQCGYDAAADAEKVIEETDYDAERDTANPADSVFVNHSGSDIVKWDEVPEYMHIPSVLRAGASGGSGTGAAGGAGMPGGRTGSGAKYGTGEESAGDAGVDPREAARRRMAAENDLKRIFEMTYGKSKPKRYIESKTISADDEISEENAARNEEIKARHLAKNEKKTGGAGRAAGSESSEGDKTLLLVDGYNLIFADKEMKELAQRDIGSARDSLIERLVNYAGYTGIDVKIVFDAYKVVPGDGSIEGHSGVEVVYTAANELADVRIGRMAREAGSRKVYVVSSDRLVQQDVWTKGAMRISSREFTGILSDTEEEIRSKLSF